MTNKVSLMSSILQYAMEGKLVSQNLNDISVFDLIKSINQEYLYLLKNGEITKQNHDNTLLFKNNSYILIENGKEIPIEKKIINSLPKNWSLITQKNIFWLDNGIKSEGEKLPILNAKFLRTGENPIFANSGIIVTPKDKIILVDGENSGEVFIPHCKGYIGSTFKILKFTKLINHDFLLLILKINKEKYKNNKTGVAIPHLNKKMFRNDLVMIPPIEEQERIVAKIKKLEPLLDKYEELIKQRNILDENLAKKIIQSTIKHELDKTNSKDNNWKTVKLSDIGNIVGGKTPNTEILRYWENGNIEWITPSDMNSNPNNYQLLSSKRKITECALKEKSIKLIEPGSIIMSSRAPIGYLGINKMPTCIGCGCKSLTIKNDKKYLNKYVYFAIYNSLPSIIEKASGVTFKEVYGSQFNEITIDIPTFEEQVKIVDKIEKILKLIDKLVK